MLFKKGSIRIKQEKSLNQFKRNGKPWKFKLHTILVLLDFNQHL